MIVHQVVFIPSGYQTRGLSPLSKRRHMHTVVTIMHGPPVYIRCVGINNAVARSVFHSNQTVMDKTSPRVELISSIIIHREVTTMKQLELSRNDST